ncbi:MULTISPECIES: LuxR C-terminal-related transcriptional regulator [Rhodococcus]|uniref:LuxR C-terminal-related transcriptional regulator n=1 Tax=Rhodococcus cercidiphylli TaxID=489916 RepID=A0ABU4B1E2_9NOCA|nr:MULTISPECIES: LuxR C-terminal-related transcriptional regulator [Rhodococcus]KAA0923860.1 helix-turn-helix transcriptional regulator [Rhodococcus sp. ANT_H53B]MDV6232312.1 LuxR C-terminal-related transcriptional regulator [Rhodococcus cercidiphylli]
MSPAPLVARGELLDALVDEVQDADARSKFVVVDGAAGVGKTAVLRELAARLDAAEPRPRVRQVSAVPWETSRPWEIAHQCFPEIDVADGRTLPERIAGSNGPSVTAVLIDDAQDADADSLRVLASTVRRHRDSKIAVVCIRRILPTGSIESHEILDRAADTRFVVEPLGSDNVAELAALRGVILSPSSAAHLTAHTGGRPKQVSALLSELPGHMWTGVRPELPAPEYVQASVRAALSESSADTVRLVQAVAVLDGARPVSTVCEVAEIDDPSAALDLAEALGLVLVRRRSGITLLECPDGMIRAAVLATMSRTGVADVHRAAASAESDPADRLAHRAEAALLPEPHMADELESLAAERARTGEWATAARLFMLSSRASGDAGLREDRLVRGVDALIGAGDVRGASDYIAEIESLHETPSRNAVLGYLAILRGRPQEADARLTRAWQLVRTRHDRDVAAVICHRQVLHNLARCDGGALVYWADRAVELVGSDHPTAVEAQAIRGLGLAGTGRVAEALASYEDLWGQAGTGAVGQRVQMGAGWLHLATDSVELARSELEAAAPTDFLGGSTRIALWANAWLARTYFVTGEWDAALRIVGRASDLADSSGAALIVPLLQWTAMQIHALRGDWDAAAASSRRGESGARDYEIMRVPTALGRAAISEARADYAGVLRALSPLTQQWAHADVSEPGFWAWPDVYANALIVEGRLDEADAFLTPHEARVAERGHRSAHARLACARGRWHGATGDMDSARASFEDALDSLMPLPLVYDRARVNYAYGQTLRRAGKRREADVVVTAARDDYLSLGATTYVRRCDRELKAGGVHAILKDRPHNALTPQEDAVSSLVATGLTNREVAAELFLSVKTVQFHLTRVYAKLGVRSRSELAAARASESTPP